MRHTYPWLFVLLTIALAGGCEKGPGGPGLTERREKAIGEAVDRFRQRPVALEAQHPALAGAGNSPHSELGFAFVNDAIDPRLHISVSVEDASGSGRPAAAPAAAEKLEGTSFATALQMECSDPGLKQEVEKAYALLREDLRQIGE